MVAVRPGLSLALATSVLGYAALLFMSFPAVRQIALFALSGLIAAYLAVILLLPQLLKKPYEGSIDPTAIPAARFIEWWSARVNAKTAAAIALAAFAVCAPGWLQLHADDDVRALSSRPAGLLEQETRIRSLTGVEIGTRYFVVEGRTPETALQTEERLVARLRELSAEGELANFQAISSFVPSAARQEDNRALLRKTIHSDGKRLEQAFEHVGLRIDVAGELERAYQQSEGRLLTPETWLATPGAAPFRHLWLGKTENGYTSVVIPMGVKSAERLAVLAADVPGVWFVDKAASVSRLFSQYRKGLSYGLIAAMVLVLGLLCWRYGRYGGVATLLPAALGIAAALALSGYLGWAMTVFSMMALLLVLGVGVNYSIFLMEGRTRPGTTGVAVLLSASTTVLSFGLLAFSGTPALSGFGAMLLIGIAVTVLATPLALSISSATEAK